MVRDSDTVSQKHQQKSKPTGVARWFCCGASNRKKKSKRSQKPYNSNNPATSHNSNSPNRKNPDAITLDQVNPTLTPKVTSQNSDFVKSDPTNESKPVVAASNKNNSTQTSTLNQKDGSRQTMSGQELVMKDSSVVGDSDKVVVAGVEGDGESSRGNHSDREDENQHREPDDGSLSREEEKRAHPGWELMESNNWDKARKAFEDTLVQEGDDPDALLGASKCFLRNREPSVALQFADRALRSDKPHDRLLALHCRGTASLQLGKLRDAESACKEALEIDSIHQDSLLLKASICMEKNEVRECGSIIDHIIEDDPDCPLAWNLKGRLYLNAGKYEKAILAYDEALRCDPSYVSVYLNKGAVLEMLHKFDQALAAYNAAVDHDPEMAIGYVYKGAILSRFSKFTVAFECFDLALQKDKRLFLAHYNYGLAKKKAEKLEDAIKHFDKAIDLNPNHADAYQNKAICHRNLNQNQDAIKAYNKVIKLDPLIVNAYSGKASCLLSRKMYDQALESYRRVIELNQKRKNEVKSRNFRSNSLRRQTIDVTSQDTALSDAYYGCGICAYHLEKYEESQEYLSNAIDMNPRALNPYLARGETLRALKRYDEALKEFDRALEIDPIAEEPLVQKSRVYKEIRELKDALSTIETAMAIDTENLNYVLEKGDLQLHLQRFEGALKTYEGVLAKDTKSYQAHFGKGRSLLGLQKLDEAFEVFETLLEDAPNQNTVLLKQAQILFLQKDFQSCKSIVDKILLEESDNEEVQELSHKLSSL